MSKTIENDEFWFFFVDFNEFGKLKNEFDKFKNEFNFKLQF